jgi:hypothetical protein
LACSHGVGIGNACFLTTEGNGKCLADRRCSELADCVTSADCGDGVCIKDSCCVRNVCFPAADFCDDFEAGLTRYSQSPPTGPTGTSLGDS